jgi:hypothetical protein
MFVSFVEISSYGVIFGFFRFLKLIRTYQLRFFWYVFFGILISIIWILMLVRSGKLCFFLVFRFSGIWILLLVIEY